MVNCHKLSERHACALVALSRDTYRHESQTSILSAELHNKIVETAHPRRRWGYRMIHDVLHPQFPVINHKRVYRLYTAEGLSIRKRKKTKCIGVRVPLVAALAVNQSWSMDFVSDAICRPGAIARRIKCLTVEDDFTHDGVDITADFGIGGHYVTWLLDRALRFGASPHSSARQSRATAPWPLSVSVKKKSVQRYTPRSMPFRCRDHQFRSSQKISHDRSEYPLAPFSFEKASGCSRLNLTTINFHFYCGHEYHFTGIQPTQN